MSRTNKESPLVAAVLNLQTLLDELERVGQKITSTDLTADIDIEHIQKLMARFAEYGEQIPQELANLSAHLQEARSRAEAVAQKVSQQAQVFDRRRSEIHERMAQFQKIGERVRELNQTIRQSESPDTHAMSGVLGQLSGIIDELKAVRDSARDSRMKSLERDAESLAQSLQSLQAKLRALTN